MIVLDEGRPIFIEGDDDRIGRGPWARWFATSVVPDEGSPRAERGRTAMYWARNVGDSRSMA